MMYMEKNPFLILKRTDPFWCVLDHLLTKHLNGCVYVYIYSPLKKIHSRMSNVIQLLSQTCHAPSQIYHIQAYTQRLLNETD